MEIGAHSSSNAPMLCIDNRNSIAPGGRPCAAHRFLPPRSAVTDLMSLAIRSSVPWCRPSVVLNPALPIPSGLHDTRPYCVHRTEIARDFVVSQRGRDSPCSTLEDRARLEYFFIRFNYNILHRNTNFRVNSDVGVSLISRLYS